MTDRDIIQGLIDRDNRITERFFYVDCRPLLTAIMKFVFSYPVEYDEMVSELYQYIMANDAAKLRRFEYRSSIYQWLKVVATRYFIRRRSALIDDTTKEPPCVERNDDMAVDTARSVAHKIDLDVLLEMLGNKRQAETIRHLVLEDEAPERYADEIGVTVGNLYNIKKRAMSALTRVAIKYYGYEG